jgi:putative membrane protein
MPQRCGWRRKWWTGSHSPAPCPRLLGVAIVFGVLNVLVRPILKLVTCPFYILTLGLFTFVVNAVMLLITSAASEALGLGFHVDGFVPAFIGALVVLDRQLRAVAVRRARR